MFVFGFRTGQIWALSQLSVCSHPPPLVLSSLLALQVCISYPPPEQPGSYGETVAPTSKFSIISTICAIAAQEILTLYQFDIKGAFLMAPCKEPVYINLPGRYRLPNGKMDSMN